MIPKTDDIIKSANQSVLGVVSSKLITLVKSRYSTKTDMAKALQILSRTELNEELLLSRGDEIRNIIRFARDMTAGYNEDIDKLVPLSMIIIYLTKPMADIPELDLATITEDIYMIDMSYKTLHEAILRHKRYLIRKNKYLCLEDFSVYTQPSPQPQQQIQQQSYHQQQYQQQIYPTQQCNPYYTQTNSQTAPYHSQGYEQNQTEYQTNWTGYQRNQQVPYTGGQRQNSFEGGLSWQEEQLYQQPTQPIQPQSNMQPTQLQTSIQPSNVNYEPPPTINIDICAFPYQDQQQVQTRQSSTWGF